jgi:hypothetical protein
VGTGDLLAALLVAGAAVALLVRTVRVTGGGCAACPRPCRRAGATADAVVRIGRPR